MDTTTAAQSSKTRFKILALIFVSVIINYMDRSNMSVAASALSSDLSLSEIQMGWIFGAFGLTYALFQIPGGVVVDYVKPRILYPFILVGWSVATLIQGFVGSFAALIGCRMTIGVFEAPSYPCNNKIVSTWFREEERASAIAFYTSGQFIGLAFLMPVLFFIQDLFGWRGLFIVSGLTGIIWAVIWYVFYRDPESLQGPETVETPAEPQELQKFEFKQLVEAFSHKKLWGIYLGQYCLGGLQIFFLTWFPKYLQDYRDIEFVKSGFLASLPFLGAFCGVILSGTISDFLVRRNISSKEVARKAPIILGMMISTAIIGANYTDNTFWLITFMTIAFFGSGLASIAWVFVSLLAPTRMVGLVGGCFNAIGGIAGFTVPTIIGYLVQCGDFKPALTFVGVLAIGGFLSYLLLVGKVEKIEEKYTDREPPLWIKSLIIGVFVGVIAFASFKAFQMFSGAESAKQAEKCAVTQMK